MISVVYLHLATADTVEVHKVSGDYDDLDGEV